MAIATTIGPRANVISPSRRFCESSTTLMTQTKTSWLSRSTVSVTTVAKSCVSEVTRLTMRPEAY